ncbi:MAG: VWA domain-containing protein [Candidatus Cloacimonetes bacterium]|nr:VWA domain-containing protein [Candidatus Cloacimonadota bacterium]
MKRIAMKLVILMLALMFISACSFSNKRIQANEEYVADGNQEPDGILAQKDLETASSQTKSATDGNQEPERIAAMKDMVTAPYSQLAVPQFGMSSGSLQGGAGAMGINGGGSFGGLPQNFNTDEFSALTPNIFHSPFTEPYSTFSIDVDTASYSTIRKFLNENRLPPANAIRSEEVINYFTYDYPKPRGDHPFSVYTEMGICPWNSKRNLVHIGLLGRSIDVKTAPPSNLVFLLDTSGSMRSPNRLPLVIDAMKLLVQNMREQDRVAIVTYAGSAGLALASTSGANKSEIYSVLDALRAEGSTAGGEGIRLAYRIALENMLPEGNNRVILCTDGDFNVGVSSTSQLEELISEYRDKNVFLTVLGFGMGNYKDNRLETLSNKGNGNYAYIDNIKEAKKVLVNEMGGTLYTIAKDVKIQVEFNPAHVKAYRLVGYENRLLRPEDFKDDTKDAGDMGAGHSVTALYEIIPADSKEEIPGVDSLKYQDTIINEEARKSPELMNVKIRYKQPQSDKSIALETPVNKKVLKLEDTSNNFMWSVAAASFAMMLQKSEYRGNLNWSMLEEWARSYMGADPEGYRIDMLDLIKKAKKLDESKE